MPTKTHPKHIFFDMDGTLARSRLPLEPSMTRILKKLSKEHDVIVVSGSDAQKLVSRMGSALKGSYYVLGQNGNTALDKSGKPLWENRLTWRQKYEAFQYADKIVDRQLYAYKDLNDLVEDRGAQVGFSLIGHNEHIDTKEAFDPDRSKRLTLLKKYPFVSETLEVTIGGTTCLDFYLKGSNKGTNVKRLIKELGWNKKESLYVGDCLFPGGNDETVVGIIPCHGVDSPADTERFLEELLKSSK